MSWHRILLPYTTEIDPDVVNIGKLAWDCYQRENKPQGFAMFHAREKSEDGKTDKRVVYLSPVATSLCTNIAESYEVEPCDVPARDEPEIAFVFGDHVMMGQLQESYEVKLANSAKSANSSA